MVKKVVKSMAKKPLDEMPWGPYRVKPKPVPTPPDVYPQAPKKKRPPRRELPIPLKKGKK